MIGAFTRFQPADTVSWFQNRGIELKVEEDGRMFPVTDSSQTIIDCLLNAARQAKAELRSHAGVASVTASSSSRGPSSTYPFDTITTNPPSRRRAPGSVYRWFSFLHRACRR